MARKRAAAQGVLIEADASKGIVRDAPRVSIPNSGVYDSTDFLLHQPGVAQKRGGTSYAGPALTAATYARTVTYAEFPAGAKLVASGDNAHFYTVTSGTTTDLGGLTVTTVDQPKLRVGSGKNILVIPNYDGISGPYKYEGSGAIAVLGGTPSAGRYCAIYKTRLVLGNSAANPNRMFFSPTPDIESTWDTANSYIDADYEITGLAALHNALLIFSKGHTERIIGSTPPPGSDMDRAPIGSVGCTDARSIVVQEDNCLFANPRGVYLTNGAGFASLTTEGLIESYWQGLFSGYDPATWVISAGVFRSFYFVSILDASGNLVDTLMCNVPRRAWARLTNIKAMMFSQAVGASEELYYADRSTNRVVAMSGIFNPAAANKNDANSTAVTPTLEYRAIGDGTGIKSFGFGRLTYTMTDAASDNPTLAVTVKRGVDADTSSTPAESPLAETTTKTRKRFTVFKDAQSVTIRLAQTNASAKTEINALEVEQAAFPLSAEGVA